MTIKIVQIHTYYDEYISQKYTARKELADLPFERQIEQLYNDGFSAANILAPTLKEIGLDAHLIIGNNPFAQVRWAQEHGFTDFNQHNWMHAIARAQVEYYAPDVLYLTNPIRFDSNFTATLKRRPPLIVGWLAAVSPDSTSLADLDLHLCNEPVTRQMARGRGVKVSRLFFHGFPDFLLRLRGDCPKKYDVVFSGQCMSEHVKRVNYLRDVGKAPLGFRGEFSIGYFIPPQPQLPAAVTMYNQGAKWGMDMYRALSQGKVVLNPVTDFANGASGNMRQFEVTGVGSFLLTEHHDSLSKYFELGKEIESFRDSKELLDKIYYYLAHPQEREEIALRGQKRCLTDCSLTARAREFLIYLEDVARTKGVPLSSSAFSTLNPANTTSVDALIDRALHHLKDERAFDAFREVVCAMRTLPQDAPPPQHLNYVRAMCLIELQDLYSAEQALKTELQYHPATNEITELLRQVQQEMAKPDYWSVPKGIVRG